MTSDGFVGLLFMLLFVAALVGIYWLVRHFISGGSHVQEIIKAEKNRQAHPDIQSGRFTRLYTMPYYEDLNEENIRRYCEEHFPSYYCKVSEIGIRISETRTGLSGEVRDLYITHLREYNISAVDLSDPKEVEYNGRYRPPTVRSSLHDKGFGKDIRDMICHFQQQALSRHRS